jgi:hypothetical protein
MRAVPAKKAPPLKARDVSAVLVSAGISVGYRYRQTGYEDRHGNRVTGPGVQVTRLASTRYSGEEDQGYVSVILIADPQHPGLGTSEQQSALRLQVLHALVPLVDQGYIVRRHFGDVVVEDP